MNGSTGKEAWLGFGLGGMLLYNLPTVPPEHYRETLVAGCVLAVLSGLQRTVVKWMEMGVSKSEPFVVDDTKEGLPDETQQ